MAYLKNYSLYLNGFEEKPGSDICPTFFARFSRKVHSLHETSASYSESGVESQENLNMTFIVAGLIM